MSCSTFMLPVVLAVLLRRAKRTPFAARTIWLGCTGPSRARSSMTSWGKFSAVATRSRRNARAVR
jgi:hypothetical protein